MPSIIFATDLAPDMAKPLRIAAAVARAADLPLKAVHASVDPDAPNMKEAIGEHEGVTIETLVHTCCEDPVDTLLDAMRKQTNVELVITGTHQKSGWARMMQGSVSEALVRTSKAPVLCVPIDGSCVTSEGQLLIRSFLVPVGHDLELAQTAVNTAVHFAEMCKIHDAHFKLLHVGPSKFEDLECPARHGWTWDRVDVEGSVQEAILQHSLLADLLVMTSRGHDSVMDTMLGSNTERVTRKAPGPVLCIKVD